MYGATTRNLVVFYFEAKRNQHNNNKKSLKLIK